MFHPGKSQGDFLPFTVAIALRHACKMISEKWVLPQSGPVVQVGMNGEWVWGGSKREIAMDHHLYVHPVGSPASAL